MQTAVLTFTKLQVSVLEQWSCSLSGCQSHTLPQWTRLISAWTTHHDQLDPQDNVEATEGIRQTCWFYPSSPGEGQLIDKNYGWTQRFDLFKFLRQRWRLQLNDEVLVGCSFDAVLASWKPLALPSSRSEHDFIDPRSHMPQLAAVHVHTRLPQAPHPRIRIQISRGFSASTSRDVANIDT